MKRVHTFKRGSIGKHRRRGLMFGGVRRKMLREMEMGSSCSDEEFGSGSLILSGDEEDGAN